MRSPVCEGSGALAVKHAETPIQGLATMCMDYSAKFPRAARTHGVCPVGRARITGPDAID